MTKAFTAVAAHPGWFVACPVTNFSNGEIESILWEPVIAWHIETTETRDEEQLLNFTLPVTVDPDFVGLQVLKRPDGSITKPGHKEFNSEQDLLNEYNEKAKKEREQNAAKKP